MTPHQGLSADVESVLAEVGFDRNDDGALFRWPEVQPLNTDLPSVKPFDLTLLPRNIAPWVQDIAERQQCPADYVGVAAMVTFGSLIGRKLSIHPKARDNWRVTPNLWGCVIGRSSTMKTPALSEALRPLQRLAVEAGKRYRDESDNHQVDAIMFEAAKKNHLAVIQKAIKTGKPGDIAAAQSEAKEHLQNEPQPPSERRYIVNDATVEKLGELLNQNPQGLLLERDELTGWLKSLDREDRANDRSFYLEAFNGTGRYTYDRIGRGTIHIDSTCVSIIGGIQPSRLRPYVWHAVSGGVGDDGLLQRLQLAVWPDITREYQNVDRWPDKDAKDSAWQVFERLDDLPYSPDDDGDPPSLRFSDEAQELFNAWRTWLEKKIRAEDIHPAIESHLTKYRSLLPSLALIVHVCESHSIGLDLAMGKPEPVSAEAFRKAQRWCDYLESHMGRIYAAAANPAAHAAALIFSRRQKLPNRFTSRDVQRKGWPGLDTADCVRTALKELEECGYVRSITLETGGRRTVQHEWNPKINPENA